MAAKLAEVQTELAALPIAQQYTVISLADKLRNISASLAAAGELGAATSRRLSQIANKQACRVDEDDPMSTQDVLQGISALNKLSNESASIGLALLAANKEAVQKFNAPPPESDVTVIELVALLPR